MITAVFKEDIEKFENLAPKSEWKKHTHKSHHAIGSVLRNDSGAYAGGVLLYQISTIREKDNDRFIYVNWVYASDISEDKSAVYEELFGEAEAVAERLGIDLISIKYPPDEAYNSDILSAVLTERDYYLTYSSDANIYGIKAVE